MKCGEILELVAGYRNKTLHETLMSGVKEHLGACVKCRAEFEAYEKAAGAIVSGIEEIEPSPDYIERFAAKVAADAARKQRGKSLIWERLVEFYDSLAGMISPHPARRFAIAAAFAVVIGLSLLFVGVLNEKEGDDENLFETIVVAEVALNADMLEDLELVENLEGLENMELIENLEEYLN
ncbi:MAG: hypothetical protein FJ088_08395 [Deltaproteobacteria bacterium]|nr:hypothetical protein [Deltaproteobacteria bacterium]